MQVALGGADKFHTGAACIHTQGELKPQGVCKGHLAQGEGGVKGGVLGGFQVQGQALCTPRARQQTRGLEVGSCGVEVVWEGATRWDQVGGKAGGTILRGGGPWTHPKLWGGGEGVRVQLNVKGEEGEGGSETVRGDAVGVQEVGGEGGGTLGRGGAYGVGDVAEPVH